MLRAAFLSFLNLLVAALRCAFLGKIKERTAGGGKQPD
jgi:hypothetical protein